MKMNTDPDFELVEEYIAGSEAAFNRLVMKYHKKIYWHARRMLGNHSDADEVTQEVLIVLYKKLKTFKFNSSLFTWIYKITATRSLNQIKRRSLRKYLFLDDPEVRELNSENDIVQEIDDREKLQKVNSVMEKLPPRQREVFIFRQFEELTYEEIADITGKSVGSLKASYFHAIKKVMEMIEK